MEKYKSFEIILTNLNILKSIISSKVKRGDTSTNKQVESFYGDILNMVYGWNLERLPKINAKKIQKTLKSFDKHYEGYNRLIIFNITSKTIHRTEFKSAVAFDTKRDIMDIDDLLNVIDQFKLERIKEIADYVTREIPYYIERIKSENDILGSLPDYRNTKPKNCNKFLKMSDVDPKKLGLFKQKVTKVHEKLLEISLEERKAFVAFLTKCERKELALKGSTWADILKHSFGFDRNRITSLAKTLIDNEFLSSDDDEFEPRYRIVDKNFWKIIYKLLDDNQNELYDFICNVNFSKLDE